MGRRTDALSDYRKKRDFRRTGEPRGAGTRAPAKRRRADAPLFCVQKHAARRLHYDFRLEIDGVLKSWAVPKGPSLDPSTQRLAVPTEDHPLEYADFEGVIPKGEYGGGTVMLWDRGTYRARGDAAEAYARGRLVVDLEGEKLRGGFTLVRTSDDAWLFRKRADEFAKPGGAADRPARARHDPRDAETKSVKTGRDLESIAAVGEPATMPRTVAPALATLVDAPPEGNGFLHEIKLDGYRVLARVERGRGGHGVRLSSRSGQDWTRKMPEIAEALRALPEGIYDGEAVVYDDEGKSHFGALVEAIHGRSSAPIVYAIFDLLFLEGRDLRAAPLEQRKARLLSVLRDAKRPELLFCDHVVGEGRAFFDAACAHGLEGIVSKQLDAPYPSGRSRRWLKVRCQKRQEFVIAGYTPHTAEHDAIGALVLAAHDASRGLRYAGKVGTGFSDADRRALKRKLDALGRKGSPLDPEDARLRELAKVRWARPELVGEVCFTEWTEQGRLRHPTFAGLREDKPAAEVVREAPTKVSAARALSLPPLSNPDKILYPGSSITKRDLALYYATVADRMLPHALGRPLMFLRCPDGLHKSCWYQKHPTGTVPEGFDRVRVKEKGSEETYLVVRSASALVGLAQLGALEVHSWGSRADRLEQPDRIVFDLDPAPDVPFDAVISAAVLLRERLASIDLESFAMVTGGKGVHVVVPIERRHDFEVVKAFSGAVANALAREAPQRFLAKMTKKARQGRIFIDYFRNGRGATAICPYSTRAQADATISMPVTWRELETLGSAAAFTIADAEARMRGPDPWSGYEGTRQRLRAKVLELVRAR